MSKAYIIQFEAKNDLLLKERSKALSERWMNYFPGSIIIQSSLTSSAIYNQISMGLEAERILIIELNTKNYWGVMPKDAWEWLKV